MAYDDDDDLFGEEFDFVDDDDDTPTESSDQEEDKGSSKSRKPASGSSRGKPPARPRGRASKPAPSAGRREPPRDTARDDDRDERGKRGDEPDPTASDFGDRAADEDEFAEARPAEPTGPPADHVIHIYEHGKFKRTLPRKFTDEEAVNFAEEYTRTGKAYGRYAIATPEDEEPAEEFADAAKG
jgi:hypothetical protein